MVATSTAWSDAAFVTFAPRPRLTLSQWADVYRVIPRGTSPEAGQWRTDRVPYLREPMDAISDRSIERVVCQWASQLGKSDGIILNAIGYYADQDPSPILLVQPTEIAAAAFSKERLEPTFRESPILRGKLSESLRDKANTILLKQFPGGYLACAWATSSVSLASRPIRVVIGDEIDRWPDSVGRDGDPWAQAVQRSSNFHNRKIIAVSTPTIEGVSRIAMLYEDSDQRRLWVPCPLCGVYQVLEWEGVRYKNERDEIDVDETYYRCRHCKGKIEERARREMLEHCEWRPDNPGHPNRGYQLSALYSPWVHWSTLAAEWVKAHKDRDKRGQQEFINLRLGEPWVEEGSEITHEALEKNRDDYGAELAAGVLLLTAGVDVQDNRLEAEIVGWGAGRESWGIHYAIFLGDTSTLAPWNALDQFLQRAWTYENGSGLTLDCTCIDSGGHRTDEVYDFCRTRLARNVFPIKGRAGAGHPIAGKPTLNKLRAPMYLVGVDGAKEALYSRLLLADPGPGYCHFPREKERGYDGEYFRGLVSERRKARVRAGRRTLIWEQKYQRNEPLDCRNYATAAMELLLLSTPDLFEQRAARVDAPPPPSRPPPRRRILSRGIG